MNAWDIYENRISAHGGSKRNASLMRETRFINHKLPDNLSYQSTKFYLQEYGYNIDSDEALRHSFSQNVAVIDSDNLNEKYVYSMPSEDIRLGTLLFWMNNYWLVTERDANTTVYTRAKILQCNHLLKWISPENKIMEQWCVVEDGTKYLTGELEDRSFVVTRGDSRISVQLARNQHTAAFDREYRFLIDDPDSPHKLSYLLTKPLKTGLTYKNDGTYKFVLQEVTATEYDNHELGIADYYKYFPRHNNSIINNAKTDVEIPDGKKVWI